MARPICDLEDAKHQAVLATSCGRCCSSWRWAMRSCVQYVSGAWLNKLCDRGSRRLTASDHGLLHYSGEIPGFLAVGVIAHHSCLYATGSGAGVSLVLLGVATALNRVVPVRWAVFLTITIAEPIGFHYTKTRKHSRCSYIC